MRYVHTAIWAALLFAVVAPASAQNGCIHSPENPTALLAGVGAAGGFFSYARARRRARKGK